MKMLEVWASSNGKDYDFLLSTGKRSGDMSEAEIGSFVMECRSIYRADFPRMTVISVETCEGKNLKVRNHG